MFVYLCTFEYASALGFSSEPSSPPSFKQARKLPLPPHSPNPVDFFIIHRDNTVGIGSKIQLSVLEPSRENIYIYVQIFI